MVPFGWPFGSAQDRLRVNLLTRRGFSVTT